MLQKKAKTLSKQELDLEIAEFSYDIDFLERQVEADLGSYSPKELSNARAKIGRLKLRSEILKIELSRRGNDS
ncbi:MAG: hypothetical protein ACHQ1H_06865 [Nitrososphaerales archaeon]